MLYPHDDCEDESDFWWSVTKLFLFIFLIAVILFMQ